jgi:hypothetical protein
MKYCKFDEELSSLLYSQFAKENKKLIKKYGKTIVHASFYEILTFLSSTNEKAIPIDTIATVINQRLNKIKIHVLNPHEIIKAIMDFLGPFFGFVIDIYENHREDGNKILWPILARYTKNPAQYTDQLFTDIATYFFKQEYASVIETSEFIIQQGTYKELPDEAIWEAVDALYDYFVEKGNISNK